MQGISIWDIFDREDALMVLGLAFCQEVFYQLQEVFYQLQEVFYQLQEVF